MPETIKSFNSEPGESFTPVRKASPDSAGETLIELGKKSPMAAEYLLTIYLIQREYRYVSNSRLAERMKVSRSAVTQAAKRLESLGLVIHKDNNYTLTEKGRDYATSLLKRHYLIEHLLVNHLHYPWDRADEEAALLQDKISSGFADFLYEKMGRPKTCPHGNPFPDIEDEGRLLGAGDLLQCNLKRPVRVLRITEEGEEVPGMLSFCYEKNIRPGMNLEVSTKSAEGV
ncbi:MAG: metal-dependent transcriptional regulator, partial [Spirochaetales bacterium]|nr:metal-dependent transcriptional regulator [Spirochaetales bacterium]